MANDYLRSRGYPEETRLFAHGQGYDLVERPSFQPGGTMKIKAGMNIAVHPNGRNSRVWISTCDNYLVTDSGVSPCLHKTPKDIIVL